MMKMALLPLIFLSLLSSAAVAAEKVTPSHVYQQAAQLLLLVESLRKHEGVDDGYRVPGVQFAKLPIHALSKSGEVREKVARIQQEFGLTPLTDQKVPLRKVGPGDVLQSLEESYQALRQIAEKRGMNGQVATAPFQSGKTPSQVYEIVWKASYALDALAGKINPSKVYRNTEEILSELSMITDHFSLPVGQSPPPLLNGKRPLHVNIAAFRNLHQLVALQKKLGMKRARVDSFPEGKISPAEVYDTTNMLKAELVRIRLFLGITTPQQEVGMVEGKTPNHVYQNMEQIHGEITRLIDADGVG